jgi:hypothetical protein
MPPRQSSISLAQNAQAHVEVANTTPSALGTGQDTHEPRNKRDREPEPSSVQHKRTKTQNESSSKDQALKSLPESPPSTLSEHAGAGASQQHENLDASEPDTQLIPLLGLPQRAYAQSNDSQSHQEVFNSFHDFQAVMQAEYQSRFLGLPQTSHSQSYDSQSHQDDASNYSHGHAAVSSPVEDHEAM